MTFVPDDRDRAGVDRLEWRIRRDALPYGLVARIACFNFEEAMRISDELIRRGIPEDRFFVTWLLWPGDGQLRATHRAPEAPGGPPEARSGLPH